MKDKELNEKLKKLKEGCGKKVDINGCCWYVSSQGNFRYCSKCLYQIKKIEEKKYE